MKRILWLALLLVATNPGNAQVIESTGFDLPWTVNIRSGTFDDRFSTQGSFFVPVSVNGDSLRYLSTSVIGESGDRQYYSVGFGFRNLIDDGSIIGLGVFYDRAELGDGNSFDQLGVSFERLSWGLDFRLNGYLASKEQYVTGGLAGYGDLFAQDFGIYQTMFVEGAEAYTGGDLEFAKRFHFEESVPFWFEASLGGYLYNSDRHDTIAGFKGGVEIGLTENISIEANYYGNEELLGANTYVGLRAQFALGRSSEGAPQIRSSHFVSRNPVDVLYQRMMSEGVERQSRVLHSETVSRSIEIEGDVIFVNEGDAVGNGIGEANQDGSGSAEDPFESVQDAANLAATKNRETGRVWTVYTQGIEGREYNEDVKIMADTRFTSSAIPIQGRGGFTFGNGVRPVVDGGFQAANLEFVEIAGYDIKDGGRTALPGAGDFTALDNDLAGGLGDGVYMENVKTVVLKDNIVREAKNFGVAIVGSTGNQTTLIAENNVVKESDEHGFAVYAESGWRGLASLFRNRFESNEGDGLHIEVDGNGWSGTVADNTAVANDGDGFQFSFENNFAGRLTGNMALNNGDEGIQFDVDDDMTGTFANNTATGNGGDGIAIDIGEVLDGGTISGNGAGSNNGKGLEIEIGDKVNDGSVISSNRSMGNGEEGIVLEIDGGGGDFEGSSFTNNIAIGNGTSGSFSGIVISLDEFQDGASIDGNNASGNTDHGIDLSFGNDISGGANSISNNTGSNNTGGDGIRLRLGGGKVDDGLSFNGNTANGNNDDGIDISFSADFEGSTFNGNTANNNGGDGIVMDLDGNDFEDGSEFQNNVTNNNGDDGVDSDVDEEAGIVDSGNSQAGNGDDARDDNGADDLGNNVSDN